MHIRRTILVAAASGATPVTAVVDAGIDPAAGDWTGCFAGFHAARVMTDELEVFNPVDSHWPDELQSGYLHQISVSVLVAEVELTGDLVVQENWSVLSKGWAIVTGGTLLLNAPADAGTAGPDDTGIQSR